MVDLIATQPIVIDNGSGVIKAGFAGSEKPRLIFANAVGRVKHPRVMVGGALESSSSIYVGRKVDEHRGAMKILYPMEHGVVTLWRDMERIWLHIYERENLGVPIENHPVMLTEAPLNPYRNRQKYAEIFFETFGVPALFVAPQAILSLYASGRTTGTVLDCGDGVTHCVPVYEGFSMQNSIVRSDIAGRDVTERMQLLLRRSGYSFHSSAEKEVVREIKEKVCYVSFDPAKEEALDLNDISYKLPDGEMISVGPERFRAPEILFNPSLIGKECSGVSDCVALSISRADMELRRSLYGSIVLSGGSTIFPGFGERLLEEMRKASPRGMKIKIAAPPERKLSTWIGGSILASLSTFKNMWITKAEFHEHGKDIMESRML